MTDHDTPPSDWYRIAEQAIGLSEPNPRVGCWLRTADGQVFEGFTQRAGGAHAEVHAMAQARAAGADLRGATAFVTLEPCSHHGRTPPCCDALVQAGVARVVVACQDPNPLVAGRGLQRLRDAGVQVQLLPADHPVAQATRELNIGFFSRMIRGRPWVRMKIAASLDGITALPDGQSQWITGEAARADGHAWRARACAVLTGIGTVKEDNPRLDVRLVPAHRQPHLVVVDSRLETPLDARLFDAPDQGGPRLVWIAHAVRNAEREQALMARGAQLLHLPGPGDKVDLHALMRTLADREVNELHVEAGHKLNGSLWQAGCVDELLVYMAPRLLGDGSRLVAMPPSTHLPVDADLQFTHLAPVGDDVRLMVRQRASQRFLLHS